MAGEKNYPANIFPGFSTGHLAHVVRQAHNFLIETELDQRAFTRVGERNVVQIDWMGREGIQRYDNR